MVSSTLPGTRKNTVRRISRLAHIPARCFQVSFEKWAVERYPSWSERSSPNRSTSLEVGAGIPSKVSYR